MKILAVMQADAQCKYRRAGNVV